MLERLPTIDVVERILGDTCHVIANNTTVIELTRVHPFDGRFHSVGEPVPRYPA